MKGIYELCKNESRKSDELFCHLKIPVDQFAFTHLQKKNIQVTFVEMRRGLQSVECGGCRFHNGTFFIKQLNDWNAADGRTPAFPSHKSCQKRADTWPIGCVTV